MIREGVQTAQHEQRIQTGPEQAGDQYEAQFLDAVFREREMQNQYGGHDQDAQPRHIPGRAQEAGKPAEVERGDVDEGMNHRRPGMGRLQPGYSRLTSPHGSIPSVYRPAAALNTTRTAIRNPARRPPRGWQAQFPGNGPRQSRRASQFLSGLYNGRKLTEGEPGEIVLAWETEGRIRG